MASSARTVWWILSGSGAAWATPWGSASARAATVPIRAARQFRKGVGHTISFTPGGGSRRGKRSGMRMIFATHVENRESILSIFQAFRPLKNYISPELTHTGCSSRWGGASNAHGSRTNLRFPTGYDKTSVPTGGTGVAGGPGMCWYRIRGTSAPAQGRPRNGRPIPRPCRAREGRHREYPFARLVRPSCDRRRRRADQHPRLRRRPAGAAVARLPADPLIWHHVAPVLARKHTVVLTDLRGYGDSGKPPSTPDPAPTPSGRWPTTSCSSCALGFDRFGWSVTIAAPGSGTGSRWTTGGRRQARRPRHRADPAHVPARRRGPSGSATTTGSSSPGGGGIPEHLIGARPWVLGPLRMRRRHGGGTPFDPAALEEYVRCFSDPAAIRPPARTTGPRRASTCVTTTPTRTRGGV